MTSNRLQRNTSGPGVGRRDVLRSLGPLAAAGLAGNGLLASACAKPQTNATSPTRSGRLRILSWPEYIDTGDEGTISRFETSSGLSVTYSEELTDNVALNEKVLEPGLGRGETIDWDIVVPTFWLSARAVADGWAEPLPLDLIPNHVNLDPDYMQLPQDRGALYTLPWQGGITGILTNTALAEPVRSVSEFFSRADLKGRVAIVSEMFDGVGMTMLSMGTDPGNGDERTTLAAVEQLQRSKEDGHLVGILDAEDYLAAFRANELVAAIAWAGDLSQLIDDVPAMAFAIPEEGGMRWFDSMFIPRGSPNVAGAAAYMNFVYEPRNAARITESVQYLSPVVGVRDVLAAAGGDAAALAENPLLFPDDSTRQRLVTWSGPDRDLDDKLNTLYQELAQ